jgi:thiamine kinase-like enzyme
MPEIFRPQEIATVHQAIAMAEVFAGDRPVPSHGDYQPHNWLVSIDGDWCGVIDFEYAPWDLRFSDLGYWWDRNFFQCPDLKDAFLAGYGHACTKQEQTQLDVIRVLSGVGRILWGCQYSDVATEELGRHMLEELAKSRSVN